MIFAQNCLHDIDSVSNHFKTVKKCPEIQNQFFLILLIASYAAWGMCRVAPIPEEERVSFIAVPQTTPLVSEMPIYIDTKVKTQADK